MLQKMAMIIATTLHSILPVFVAVFLLSSSSALPLDEQNPPQEVQVQAVLAEKPAELPPQVQAATVEKQEEPAVPDLAPAPEGAPVSAEEKADLDTANTWWGGYYRRPYYGGWGGGWGGGYGGGWRRGWGGYGGYGRGFGGGYGGWGGWGGGRYYWG